MSSDNSDGKASDESDVSDEKASNEETDQK